MSAYKGWLLGVTPGLSVLLKSICKSHWPNPDLLLKKPLWSIIVTSYSTNKFRILHLARLNIWASLQIRRRIKDSLTCFVATILNLKYPVICGEIWTVLNPRLPPYILPTFSTVYNLWCSFLFPRTACLLADGAFIRGKRWLWKKIWLAIFFKLKFHKFNASFFPETITKQKTCC